MFSKNKVSSSHGGRGRDFKGIVSTRASAAAGSGPAACGMECGGVAAAAGGFPAHAPHPAHPAMSPTERSPAKTGLHVNFSDKGEVKERREKFLTAKYGSHQMALIRKRLAVEMWLYDELQKLYEIPKESSGGSAGAASQEVEVDIDELLDMDSDDLRRRHLVTLLSDAKKPQKDVNKFINDLLEKAKTL
ncbi:protein phosphatase 1 regulatory subunit 14B isoform X2 [Amyelois transitella]|uniref:protein phosphatase 1 regulatory subunit 14B isoform X2 n=1 Tax=Amyelois transitella TaxID=680683 RepID=UPI00298FAE7C|nr:protein phosphatase 1 regulatory subunit 14B isoform X2 [Amyelois transitella]